MYFDFEKLDVYQVTLDFVAVADEVAKSLPKGRAYLRDQLRRGANSIAANLAQLKRLAFTLWQDVLP